MTVPQTDVPPMFHEGRIKIPYKWPAGKLGSAFLCSLRDDQQFLGSRCPACGKVYCPPRALCLPCHARMEELVPVGPVGTTVASTLPRAGSPHVFGLIKLDGADTALLHKVQGAGPMRRVEPFWEGERRGSILDVTAFRPTGQRATSGFLGYGIPFKPAGAAPRLPQDIAILGVATTPAGADRTAWSFGEMALEVVQELFEWTGVGHDFVDTVITSSSDFLDGRTISDMAVQDVVGAPGKSASKVSMDGLFGLLYAVARISSGLFRTALVVAHSKCSEGDPRAISRASFDPIFQRPLGITDHDALQLQEMSCMLKPDLGGVSLPTGYAPDADGAVALLLADAATAARIKSPKVWLAGAGFATSAHALGDRDLADGSALQHAARQAYQRAGIGTPRLEVAEIMDLTPAQTRLWTQALDLEGHPNVNPSGGALARNPGFATGLERLASVYRVLTERKTSARFGLAHATSGYVGQNHAVWIVRGE